MRIVFRTTQILVAIVTLAACVPLPLPTTGSYPYPGANDSAPAVTGPKLSELPYPPPRNAGPLGTPFPTPAEPAPERTFAQVGSVAHFSGGHGVSGKAIVAGLQTLIIQEFSFDGKGPAADIRLVKGEAYDQPAAVLVELEPKAYDGEFMLTIIPSAAGPGTADSIAVYAPETGEVYAVGRFGY